MRRTILLCLFSLMECMLSAQEHALLLKKELASPESSKVLVVSHRGDWRNAPENSLAAFKNCIDMGVDMIELDLKKTKDGHLILMHDNTINRTTDGKGAPSEYTLDEIRQFRLRNGLGRVTINRIPTFEEVLELTKGKILINVDKGYDYFNDVYRLLKKTNTLDQAIIKSSFPLKKIREENGDILDKVIYMPIINLEDSAADERIEEFRSIHPLAIECVFSKATPRVLELMQRIRSYGIKLWLNSLWPSLNAGHDDDMAVVMQKPDESWGWLLEQGASLIQTDRPASLIDYLKKKGRR